MIFPAVGYSYAPDNEGLAFYFFLWGMFTLVLLLGTLKEAPLTLVLTFLLLLITYIVLAAHYWKEGDTDFDLLIAGGYIGCVAGVLAMYNGVGFFLNELYGR